MLTYIKKKPAFAILLVISILFLIVSFKIAYGRYQNFDYNKFDLGNMTQVVWNTSQGRFMELTDQFGTNMPRWGMSHVDPILALLTPLFVMFPHPMILVFVQHLVLVSAVFPLFFLAKKFTKNSTIALAVAGIYLCYPALGFVLIWTEFHGLSLVAPLLLWATWLLESTNYLNRKNSTLWQRIIFWILFVLMLTGKEEVGAMLAIWGVFLFFKNKVLGTSAFVLGAGWFLVCFYLIIPSYTHLRTQSVTTFLQETNLEQELSAEKVSGKNFFLRRYQNLGSSYEEILLSPITNPSAVVHVIREQFTNNKHTLKHLFEPFLYIPALLPTTLIALPDFLINILSSETIFGIYNHRISFIMIVLFVSYIYLLKFLTRPSKRWGNTGSRIANLLVFVSLLLTIKGSVETNNPLFLAGKSFLQSKLIPQFAQAGISSNPGDYTVGQIRETTAPVFKDDYCEEDIWEIIQQYNPQVYTGPDYIGAKTAMRPVNALFPTRLYDADLIVADVFDDKAIEPLALEFEPHTIKALRGRLALGDLKHLYSCGRMYVFVPDSQQYTYTLEQTLVDTNPVHSPAMLGQIAVLGSELPYEVKRGEHAEFTVYGYKAVDTNAELLSKAIVFLTFEHKNTGYVFKRVNIASSFGEINVENLVPGSRFEEVIPFKLPERVPAGNYQVFYALTTPGGAEETMLGNVLVK